MACTLPHGMGHTSQAQERVQAAPLVCRAPAGAHVSARLARTCAPSINRWPVRPLTRLWCHDRVTGSLSALGACHRRSSNVAIEARDAWGALGQRGSGEWRDLVWCGVVVVAAAAAGLGFKAQTQSRKPAARARRKRAAFARGPLCAHSREIPNAPGPHTSSAHENN